VTPFLSKGAHTFKGRIRGEDGVRHIISLGTKDASEAKEIERMFRWLFDKRKWAVIQLVLDKQAKPTAIYDAYVGGYLERLQQDVAKRIADQATATADPLLMPLLEEWAPTVSFVRYVPQARKFVEFLGPEATVSKFRRREVSAFLDGLKKRNKKPATGSTKRRYRVGVSQFARFLVERELLDTNIVRDVKGAKENKPRMVWHTRPEAQAIISHLEGQQQALEALMAGTSMEWGAVEVLRRRDVDQVARSAWARGTKNEYRSRRVFFTEDWAWELFWQYAKDVHPTAKLFTVDNTEANKVHRAACRQAKVKESKLHDWRHTYAVYSLEDGMQPQAVKSQMGHSPNSTVVERVYAAWIPKDREAYRKRFTEGPKSELLATKVATKRGRGLQFKQRAKA
jgi:integrase